MRFRRVGIILLAALAVVVACGQFRIAKITIEEPGGPRVVTRVCLPGGKPDVFAMTERDFMCHLYDWYGLRELDGGFGLATEEIAASPVSVAAPALSDERDRQVLESLLLHLLADPEFNLTRVSADGATIVLHCSTPENTGSLRSEQMRYDIGSHTLPGDAESDLRRRNTPTDAAPDTYDSVRASYADLLFAAGIVVTDLTENWKQRRSFGAFEGAYPKARGWLEAYMPGYSEDGTSAVVRAGVGPCPHGAMLTAVLEKSGEKWVVRWYHVAFYA